ncbi:hypothetical protein DPMN_064045 [Dreissena polymorpha]|uniref:Uncharacterized protein n=1 Tax=Dreissena polymorpha TaxID=45954 RepID=A0A9D4HKT7_DREPO|nr:hypothetical protein DPMN_064045 [Dreissena polymorpha]
MQRMAVSFSSAPSECPMHGTGAPAPPSECPMSGTGRETDINPDNMVRQQSLRRFTGYQKVVASFHDVKTVC